MATKMSGVEVSKAIRKQMKTKVDSLKELGIVPSVAFIRIGENSDDIAYEKSAIRVCKKIGVDYKLYEFEENIPNYSFIREIVNINANRTIHGMLLFRPFPNQIIESDIKKLIDPDKDIDGFTSANNIKVYESEEGGYAPCTAESVMAIFSHYDIDLVGKNVAMVGCSMVVGKPAAMLMLKEKATVTMCHDKTKDLDKICKLADIIVVAVGKRNLITKDHVKDGAIIVDVGINLDDEGKMHGDVDYEEASKIASHITPVPGGVGALTSTILVRNIVKAAGVITNKEICKLNL